MEKDGLCAYKIPTSNIPKPNLCLSSSKVKSIKTEDKMVEENNSKHLNNLNRGEAKHVRSTKCQRVDYHAKFYSFWTIQQGGSSWIRETLQSSSKT